MHVLSLKLAIRNFIQRPLTRLSVSVGVGFLLAFSAVIFCFFQNISQILTDIDHSYFLTAYIQPSVSSSEETQVLSAVKKIPGVQSVQIVSKETFVQKFGQYFPSFANEIGHVDSEIIPRYLKLKAKGAVEKKTVERIKITLRATPGIEGVEENKNRFSGLISALQTFRKVIAFLLIGSSLALAILILNRSRFNSNFRKQLKQTFLLLGAPSSATHLPLLYEGLFEGLFSGVFAGLIFFFMSSFFSIQISKFLLAIGYPNPLNVSPTAVLISILVGVGLACGAVSGLWATIQKSQTSH